MIEPGHAFATTDWATVPVERHDGESGHALWRTRMMGDTRIRMLEYSADYRADHWCTRGHIFVVLEGELVSELDDGRSITLRAGQSYTVSSGKEAHRSSTVTGAKIFVVD